MRIGRVALWVSVALFAGGARAETPGAGNALAARIAQASPLVAQATRDMHALLLQVDDAPLRRVTGDAIDNPDTCIHHRAGLTPADERAIFGALVAAHLVDASADIAGVFPPLRAAGSTCPHLPQPFEAAPGGDNAGHHRWPGGLPVHTAFNAQMGLDFAHAYDHQTGLHTDHGAVIAASLWHDWAKTLVFQWQADGREFAETRVGATGAHHILGLAEAMARGLAPAQVLIQACAHEAPGGGHDAILASWLHAAAMIARVDPVAHGYLVADAQGRLRLPDAGAGGWRAECMIEFQSDQNYVQAEAAAEVADSVLMQVAGRFGYDPADGARYRNAYRNVVLSRLGADRVQLLAQHGGVSAVVDELHGLRAAGVI